MDNIADPWYINPSGLVKGPQNGELSQHNGNLNSNLHQSDSYPLNSEVLKASITSLGM